MRVLEVFDEESVQIVDYEHIPFICHKCHEREHLLRDFHLNKADNKSKPNTMKDRDSFQKVVHKGKSDKNWPKQYQSEGQKVRPNEFQVLGEEEEKTIEDQVMKEGYHK